MMNDRPTWFTRTSLGTWDPEGCLVCVINDPIEAISAVAALRTVGFTAEHVRLFLASELLGFSDALHHQGLPKRVFFFLTNLSDDAAFEAEYRAEAQQGHPILVVHAPQTEQHNQVRALLQGYHAHTARYYGPWVVTDLD